MYCNKCGTQIPEGSLFCNKCGAKQLSTTNRSNSFNSYFDIRHGILVKYNGREKNVVVPSGVIEIEKGAFSEYKLDSLTIPEGVKKAVINTFVRTIRFPSTIEEFELRYGYSKPADELYFAKGTKKIRGWITRYVTSLGESSIRFYIPSSVQEITAVNFMHQVNYKTITRTVYESFIPLNDINNYSSQVRASIYKSSGSCQYCGGWFKETFLGGQKCQTCGKKRDY